MSDHEDAPAGLLYVVNHDAMYWRARALEAERERDELQKKFDNSLDTSLRLAQTSQANLLHAIVNGAYDNVRPKTEGTEP